MRETGRAGFKAHLIAELNLRFPGCMIIHLDPNRNFQGIPDLLVLHNDKWAVLETKGSANAKRQPNQPYYVDLFDSMSYGAFVSPENEEQVLNDLQLTFRRRRPSRIS